MISLLGPIVALAAAVSAVTAPATAVGAPATAVGGDTTAVGGDTTAVGGDTICNGYGDCLLRATDNPTAPTSSGNTAAPARSARQCTSGGAAIPCSIDGAYWSSGYGCYITPTPVDPAIVGFPPEQIAAHPGQSLHQCIPYNLVAGGRGIPALGYFRWLAAGTPAAAVIDPEVLARSAIEQMNLRPVEVGLAPPSGSLGFVGLPVHMWAADPGEGTWQAARSVQAGSVSVTARAQVQRVDWAMGDGTTVSCGRGTPYDAGRGAAPSPDCGHTYTRTSAGQPGSAYPVTATSQWTVQWTASTGASGVIDLDLATQTTLRIGENQAIVTRD